MKKQVEMHCWCNGNTPSFQVGIERSSRLHCTKQINMYFEIDLEVYPYIVNVSIGQKDKELFKSLKNSGVKVKKQHKSVFDLGTGAGLFISSDDCKYLVIRLPGLPESPTEYGTLSHEVLHTVTKVMKWAGLKLSSSSEEAYTYLQGYITRKILEKIKEENT